MRGINVVKERFQMTILSKKNFETKDWNAGQQQYLIQAPS